MRKVWTVAQREFLERVRTRAFLIATVVGPLVMGLFVALPALLAGRDQEPKHVVVLDAAGGGFAAQVEERLAREVFDSVAKPRPRYRVERVAAEGRLDAVRDSLLALTGVRDMGSGAVDGVLVVTDSALESGRLTYLGSDVGSPGDMSRLNRLLVPAVMQERLVRANVDPAVAFGALRNSELKTVRVSDGRVTGESGEASFWLAYAMSFLLYLSLLLYGMQVMHAVIEEKSSRIVEVLVSSLSPFELMLGKVLGVGAVGLLQLGIWAGTATLLTSFRAQVAALLGASPSSLAELPIPTVTPTMLGIFLLFFVLGFLLYSAAYAAVGAICASQQEAHQAQMPVTLCIALGLITMFSLLGDPSGPLARTLSFVPPLAPFVIPVRYSLTPLPAWEVLAGAAVTIVGVVAVAWVAARIYRVGILASGKRPSLPELWRWVRTA